MQEKASMDLIQKSLLDEGDKKARAQTPKLTEHEKNLRVHVKQRRSKRCKTKAKRQLFEVEEDSESIQGMQKPTSSATAQSKEELPSKVQMKPSDQASSKQPVVEQVNVFKQPPLPLNLEEPVNVRGVPNTAKYPERLIF